MTAEEKKQLWFLRLAKDNGCLSDKGKNELKKLEDKAIKEATK